MLTSYAMSMAMNALVMGLIMFRILKVFLEVKPTSDERTLGSTRGTKVWHIIFIVIESGISIVWYPNGSHCACLHVSVSTGY